MTTSAGQNAVDESDPTAGLGLPLHERHRILAEQTKAMREIYAADLALPPNERDLTAFLTFDEYAGRG